MQRNLPIVTGWMFLRNSLQAGFVFRLVVLPHYIPITHSLEIKCEKGHNLDKNYFSILADFIGQGEKSSLQGVSSGELCSGCSLVFSNITFDLIPGTRHNSMRFRIDVLRRRNNTS